VKEVAREMTVKSGQKCTAIRRVFVPEALYDAAAAGHLGARLAKTTVGNPRNESVRMGALVSRAQLKAVRDGLAQLKAQADTLFDARQLNVPPSSTPTRRGLLHGPHAAGHPQCRWRRPGAPSTHLLAAQRRRAGRTAFIDDQGTLSYGELDERVRRMAAGLRAWASAARSACCC
jgi:hypothetical protein